MPLTHYIIVRRDMPLGVVCAQVTHAAGESFYWHAANRHDWPYIDDTVAVVLGVRDQKQLRYYSQRLRKADISTVEVVENAGTFAGQMTAIGVLPTHNREAVFKVLKKLNPISEVTV